MFSQLFLTTGLILIPLIFFIMTISITQKNINFINPKSEKRVGNSELLLNGLFKIIYITSILFIIYFIEIVYIVFKIKELIFILFIIFLLLVVLLILLSISKNIFIKLSDFEIRVSHIKNINYTKDMENIFNKQKHNINIFAVMAIFSHILLLIGDILLIKSDNFSIIIGAFIIAMLPYILFSNLIGKSLIIINNEILAKQDGYLNQEEVISFKKEHKEKEDRLKTIKKMLDEKLDDIKKG